MSLPKLKEFPDDNFEFTDNGRKFSKRAEKHCGGKGEIARFLVTSNFSFSPQCFRKTYTTDT